MIDGGSSDDGDGDGDGDGEGMWWRWDLHGKEDEVRAEIARDVVKLMRSSHDCCNPLDM